jgi:hypothetical protein
MPSSNKHNECKNAFPKSRAKLQKHFESPFAQKKKGSRKLCQRKVFNKANFSFLLIKKPKNGANCERMSKVAVYLREISELLHQKTKNWCEL